MDVICEEKGEITLGTRSIKTWFSVLWPVNYTLISVLWSAAEYMNSLSSDRWILSLQQTLSWPQLKPGLLRVNKTGEQWCQRWKREQWHSWLSLTRAHVTFSCEYYHEGDASPGSLPLFFFLSSSFVCFCHHDVTVNICKAEVGQIWLKDIKFYSYFTWIKIKSKGVWEVLSLLAVNMCQLPTNARPWRKLFLYISFFFFLSLPL